MCTPSSPGATALPACSWRWFPRRTRGRAGRDVRGGEPVANEAAYQRVRRQREVPPASSRAGFRTNPQPRHRTRPSPARSRNRRRAPGRPARRRCPGARGSPCPLSSSAVRRTPRPIARTGVPPVHRRFEIVMAAHGTPPCADSRESRRIGLPARRPPSMVRFPSGAVKRGSRNQRSGTPRKRRRQNAETMRNFRCRLTGPSRPASPQQSRLR